MVTSAFFPGFFTDPDGTFDFWTFLKMSKIDLRKTNLKKIQIFCFIYRMKIKNGIRYEKNGWIYLSLKGSPSALGYAHGFLVAKELKEIFKMLEFSIYEDYGYKREMFSDIIEGIWGPIIQKNYPEYYEEIVGITKGANAGGCKVTLADMLMWNCWASIDSFFSIVPSIIKDYPELNKKYGELLADGLKGEGEGGGASVSSGAMSHPLTENYKKQGGKDHCTGFIAVGSYTKDGKIVCGHNSFDNFISGQFYNVMLDIQPSKGARILMQGSAGKISSETDFYVTSYGFMCTETTIGGFNKFALKDPICCRIRQSMQYGKTLDDIKDYLVNENSGDYANAWLIGDTNTNMIMRIELGLKYVNVEKKKEGYFIGFNGVYDPRMRNLECTNVGHFDMRRHQGARHVRLTQLMEQHKGQLDLQIAQDIMADHYDIYLNKINPSSRTCCSHYELDDRAFMSDPSRPKPFQPRGAVDGVVSDTALTKKMGMMGRWGSSCGTPFDKTEFCKRNIIWATQEPYLLDRPQQPWTEFTILKGAIGEKNKTKKKEEKVMQIKKTKKNKLKL
jgi:hypothetical protein